MRNTLHISKPLKHPWCWFLLCLFSIALPSLVFSQPPVLTNDALPAGPLYELQLTQKPTHYYQLYRHAAPGTPGRLVSMVSGADPRALRDVMGPTSMAMYHVEEVPLGANIDSDNDGLTDTQELASPLLMNPLNPAPSLPLVSGTVRMPTRLAFEGMALRDDVPGALGLREVKFLIEGADTANPKLYFINTQNQSLHYYFYRDELGGQLGIVPWNSVTYFTQNRQFIAGTLAAHDHVVRPDGGTGVYTMEFWPTDPVEFNHVEMAYELIRRSMPFAEGQFVYHPAGETQRDLLELQSDDFASAHIQTITSEELYGDTDYTALNLGEAYGRLRVIGPGDTESIRDIVIFTTIPNDLSHVAGVITAAPQTPLSHINLKAKQNNTPNAYIRDAHTRPDIAPLLGQYVHYQVTPDGYILEPATQQEVDDWLEQVRPAVGVNPLANLTVTDIAPLTAIGHADADAFGSKAANLAELRSILPGVAPDGVAVPFYLYDQYMRANGFYAQAATLMAQPTFQNDQVVREAELKAFRRRIKDGIMPNWMMDELQAMYDSFPANTTLRCRSSTNNEDLPGFNGAGLYESYTHHLDEGHIMKSVKQVWAGLWTYRAWEEREFYRIDHLAVYMGVLIHPNFADEQANGVGVTRNIYDPNWTGYYINAQLGEDLVTNPEAASVPDELLVSRIGPQFQYEIQYVRFSNQVPAGTHVLSNAQIYQLASMMQTIQNHFIGVYNPPIPAQFAMEIEFKVTVDGNIAIKQARPWVD